MINDLLLTLRLSGFFLLLVLELAVVHQAADRRFGGGGDLDQIDIEFAGHSQRFERADDAQGLVLDPVQPDFRRHDLAVQAVLALDIGSATVSKSSDGVDLSMGSKATNPNGQEAPARRENRDQ